VAIYRSSFNPYIQTLHHVTPLSLQEEASNRPTKPLTPTTSQHRPQVFPVPSSSQLQGRISPPRPRIPAILSHPGLEETAHMRMFMTKSPSLTSRAVLPQTIYAAYASNRQRASAHPLSPLKILHYPSPSLSPPPPPPKKRSVEKGHLCMYHLSCPHPHSAPLSFLDGYTHRDALFPLSPLSFLNGYTTHRDAPFPLSPLFKKTQAYERGSTGRKEGRA